jgi:N-acetylmuramoyl-L-alanine amidase
MYAGAPTGANRSKLGAAMKFALSCDENPGDPGAVHNGIVERNLNIAVALALGSALTRCGQAIWADFSLTFEQRVAAANANGSDVLVACAHNASSNPAAEGAQLIICPGGDGDFRQLELAQLAGQQLKADGIAGAWSVIHEDVYECCAFDRATVYVEFLFETNPRDVAEIHSAGYATAAAESLCKALARGLGFAYVPAVIPQPPAPAPAPAPKPDPSPPPAPAPNPTPAPVPMPPLEPPPIPEPPVIAEQGVTTSEWKLALGYVAQLAGLGTAAVVNAVAQTVWHVSVTIPPELLQAIVDLEFAGAIIGGGYAISRGIRKMGAK